MATTTVMTASQREKHPIHHPIIASSDTSRIESGDRVDFEPAKHLAYKMPPEVVMMKDIGFNEDVGISPVAVSQPFKLFSEQAIDQMRAEILKPEVMDNCKFSSDIAACQIRGYANKYASFIHDAWTNPETLGIISKIAGVDLIPNMDYEIAHVNLSVKTEEQTQDEIAKIHQQRQFFAEDEGIAGCPWEDDKPVVGWHTDSYPFVCVLMLSDCTNMVGGETALRTGNGDILKVRGPDRGCAVVMQGRYISHQALRALGSQERITMVTSFRPKSPDLPDDSVLTSVRGISDLSELYYEYSEYRLEIMEWRIRKKLTELRNKRRTGKTFTTKVFKKWMAEQEHFMYRTNKEMLPDDQVRKGSLHSVEDDPGDGLL